MLNAKSDPTQGGPDSLGKAPCDRFPLGTSFGQPHGSVPQAEASPVLRHIWSIRTHVRHHRMVAAKPSRVNRGRAAERLVGDQPS